MVVWSECWKWLTACATCRPRSAQAGERLFFLVVFERGRGGRTYRLKQGFEVTAAAPRLVRVVFFFFRARRCFRGGVWLELR